MSKEAFAALIAEFEERPLPRHLADPETRARELRALDDAIQELGVDRATLVTLQDEETVGLPAGEVRVVPAWRWLLERP